MEELRLASLLHLEVDDYVVYICSNSYHDMEFYLAQVDKVNNDGLHTEDYFSTIHDIAKGCSFSFENKGDYFIILHSKEKIYIDEIKNLYPEYFI